MVSGLLSESNDEGEVGDNPSSPRKTYTEIFYEQMPYYLSLGMNDEQYWEKDYSLVIYYRKADELKRERLNQEAWLQAAYFYEALCNVSPVLHAFAKKGTKPKPYPPEPYNIGGVKTEQKAEKEETTKYSKMKTYMEVFMVNHNRKLAEGGEGNDRTDNRETAT